MFSLLYLASFHFRVWQNEDWFRVSGFGFRVSGFEFRVSGHAFPIAGFWDLQLPANQDTEVIINSGMTWNVGSFPIAVIDILIMLSTMFNETTVVTIQIFDEFMPFHIQANVNSSSWIISPSG